MMDDVKPQSVEEFMDSEDLAEVLQNGRFREFLDKIPLAIIVSQMKGLERIVFANSAFESLTGLNAAAIEGKSWSVLEGKGETEGLPLADAITEGNDHIGAFHIERPGQEPGLVDAYSTVIETEDGEPGFRLVALIDVTRYVRSEREKFEQEIRNKDLLLLELQHRVKNNLQMITALIRLEARSWPEGTTAFKQLAGRIEALSILYKFLASGERQEIDLGAYLSQVASAVMRTHAVEGIRLSLKADVCPASINIAMPTGLVVNELLTNALKHAFLGREGGTITLECLAEEAFYKVIVADDGVGLPEGSQWPEKGNLGALIVQSLKENANAKLRVVSNTGGGTRVTLELLAVRPNPA